MPRAALSVGAAQGHEEMVDEHYLAAATAAVDDNVEKPLENVVRG